MARVQRRRSSYVSRRRRKVGRSSTLRRRGRVSSLRRRPTYNARMFRMYRNPLTRARIKTCLRYSQTISLNPTPDALGAGGSNTWVFSANSLFDPDTTGTGHQPMYFDNFSNVFNRYRVNYAKITCTVVNHKVNTDTYNGVTTITNPNYAYKLAIVADRDTINVEGPSYFNQLIEEGGSNIKWRFIAPSLTGKLPKLYHFCSPHKLTQLAFNDDTLQADVGASPTRQCYFGIALASADGATDPPAGVYVHVQIQYWCEFFDRRVLQAEQ